MNINKLKSLLLKTLKIFAGILIFFILLIILGNWYISTHKKELLQKLNSELSNELNADIKIEDADIKYFGTSRLADVTIKNVSINDSAFHKYKIPTMKMGLITLQTPILKLINKEIIIKNITLENGEFNLFTLKNGYSNNYIFQGKSNKKPTKDKNKKFSFDIDEAIVKNVKVNISNEIRNKKFAGLVNELNAEIFEDKKFKIELDIYSETIAFNTLNGGFAENSEIKGDVNLELKDNKILVNPTNLNIAEKEFTFEGFFDLKNPIFDLKIVSIDTEFNKASKLLAKNIQKALKPYNVDGIFQAKCHLKGNPEYDTPYVKVEADISEGNAFSTSFANGTNLKTKGIYLNQVNEKLEPDDANSELVFTNTSCTIRGLNINAKKTSIINLSSLTKLITDIDTNGNTEILENFFGTQSINITSGTFGFKGNVTIGLNANSPISPLLNGILSFKNNDILLNNNQIKLNNLSGVINFNNQSLSSSNIYASLGNTPLVLKVSSKNYLSLLGPNPSKIITNVVLNAKKIRVNDIIVMFKPKINNYKPISKGNKNGFAALRNSLNKILNLSSVNYSMNIDKIYYNNFIGNNFKAVIHLVPNQLQLEKIYMNFSGGSIFINGKGKFLNNDLGLADVQLNINRVNINDFLVSFNQFGIKSIKPGNIQGLLTVKSNLSGTINSKGDILQNTVSGNLNLKLENGKLIDFKPLEELHVFIFKKDRFSDILLNTINNNFTIKNSNITVPRMEIQSNAWHLFVQGVYSLGNQTDMLISVPLSNLKKHDPNYIPPKTGFDNAGKMLYITVNDNQKGGLVYGTYTKYENAVENVKLEKNIEKQEKKAEREAEKKEKKKNKKSFGETIRGIFKKKNKN